MGASKNIFLISLLVLSLSSCSLLGGKSDYDSHVSGRVEFKQSDDARVVYQTQAITDMVSKDTGSKEADAYKKALGMLSISLLKNQDYGEAPPVTWTQVGKDAVGVLPAVAGIGGMYALGKEGIRAAGNVMIGENSNVSGSFNKPTATNLGGENPVVTAQPGTVDPVVVRPEVILGEDVKLPVE